VPQLEDEQEPHPLPPELLTILLPDLKEAADIRFFTLLPLHLGQLIADGLPNTSSSKSFPQLKQ
jgi:hypothetical protein